MSDRIKGYVTGSVPTPQGGAVWSVRVNQSDSPHHGTRLPVASISGGIALARGLNVNFVIGTVDDRSGRKALRAVDVRLEV